MERDPYKYFRIEAQEIVEGLSKGMLELEKAATTELVARLFRYAHTLKGAARVVKHKEIADRSHTIEEMLSPLRDSGQTPEREQVDHILRLVDEIATEVAGLSTATPAKPSAAQAASAPVEEAHRIVRADMEEVDGVVDGISEVAVGLAALGASQASLQRIARLSELVLEQLGVAGGRQTTTSASVALRSNLELLRNQALTTERTLEAGLDQTRRELGQVRGAVERLRLLPMHVLFDALGRSVRDAATTLGKNVVFEARGAELRVDADVLTRMQSALVHLVRNAVAHGIEGEKERVTAGKPASGRVVVSVTRRGGRLSFVCQDDGRGIDLEKVRRVAVERGLLPDSATAPAPKELFALLMRGGISTSASITTVAGRGVGLDAVRDVATQLGGGVDVTTTEGKGTTIEIVVASSRSSLDALVVDAGGTEVAIPLDAVRKTVRIADDELAHTPEGAALTFEGQAIPFAPLARALKSNANAHLDIWSVVVVDGRDGLAAVGVDRLIATEEIVVRALPDFAAVDAVVAGSCLDERGDPRAVLDAHALVASVRRLPAAVLVAARARQHILVIDDSVTTRMLEQSILESAGYEVETASSAEEGIEKARVRKPALFLVDVEMPGMDGFTFVAQTRADPELGVVPAILVTSRDAPEDRERGKTAGASGYIIKGQFDQALLLERIRELVGY